MLQNLSKLKQVQQQAALQQQAQQQSSLLQNALQVIANQQSIKVEECPIEFQMPFSVGFTATYEKGELEEMEVQRKRYWENMNQISKYNHPFFVQYVGLQVDQEKQQPKKPPQSRQVKRQAQKKTDKNQQSVRKQPEKREVQSNGKQKQSKQSVNQPQLMQSTYRLSIVMEESLQKFDVSKYKKQIKSKAQFIERLALVCDIVEAVSSLNDLQYTIYPENLEDLLLIKQNRIKLATHACALWRTVGEEQISERKAKQMAKFKKQSMLNPSLRYTSPEFTVKSVAIKDIRYNDVWKTGVLILTLMAGEDLSKDLLALESLEEGKLKEFRVIDQSKVAKVRKYLRGEDVGEVMRMVSVMPADRPILRAFKPLFKRLRQQMSQCINLQALQLAKAYYKKERSEKNFKLMPELKQNQELLSQDHRKKMAEYFKVNQNRVVKNYKLIYRASHTQFSCKAFYQIAYDKKGLLILVCQKLNNKKLICFSQESFDLTKCNGVFGGFIKDARKLSFMYSPQQNQFCKLKNAERAIGVSHTQGPIVGDGDLVISDGGLCNTCRFPSSYESVKLKRLLKTQRFELSEYDVYQVLF